jgi:hypothetical protein
MNGRIRLSLEREPSFFRAASLEGDPHHTAVARPRPDAEPIAMCSRSVRERYVNGDVQRVGYLSQLRVVPAWRPRNRSLLRCGFEWLAGTRRPDEASFDLSTIVADNRPARRLLTARLPGLPVYTEADQIHTLLLPVRNAATARIDEVERGSPRRWDLILACLDRFGRRHQYAPRWTGRAIEACGLVASDFLVLRRHGQVAGCLAIWDQRAFKQAVVRGYHHALACLRPFLNLFGAGLPSPGNALPLAFLSHLAVDEDDPSVFAPLVSAALTQAHRASRVRWLALGLSAGHSLLTVARRFKPSEYVSVLYTVHQEEPRFVADDRVPHVEIALL